MIFNRKIEVIFDKKDELILDGQSKICNWLYNYLLDLIKIEFKVKKEKSELLTGRNIRDLVPLIKLNKSFLYSVHSSPLKNTALRLLGTFEKFFKENTGFPKYKSWKHKWFSLYYDEPNKGFKLTNKNLRISLGKNTGNKQIRVNGKLKEDMKLKETDKIKNFRLCKEKKKFYAILCIERKDLEKKNIKNFISLDPNHKNFFVGIDHRGNSIELKQPTMIKYFDHKIDELKSKKDKCKKYSKRWRRYNKALDNVYNKRREQIKSFCFGVSHFIARFYDYAIIGDYTPSLETANHDNMHRSMLNQNIIGKFRDILEWVMSKSGKAFQCIDEKDTTKTCCICGNQEKKQPNIREFICDKCKHHLNRDINSSVNIAKKTNVLSGSDYVNWELSQITYNTEWDYKLSCVYFVC